MYRKLSDKYDAKLVEKKWRKEWQKSEKKDGEELSVYRFRNDLPKDQTFVIDTPPPTVSGLLHMGHVFSYTQADFVARYNRMKGKDVFYPMGFDDNGLPTERLVEKIIGKKAAIYEAENGAGSFVIKCREVVEEAEKEFETLFNEIALSVDWKQKYQTISPESQKISQASFIDLFNKGLVEKRLAPTFWDISDRTALAQADLIDKEVDGAMHEIEFEVDCQGFDNSLPFTGQGLQSGVEFKNSPLEGESKSLSDFGGGSENLDINPSFQINSNNITPHGSQAATVIATCSPAPPQGGSCPTESRLTATEGLNQSHPTATITIMTTRPELLAACVAVMVHPEDERFKHLVKKDQAKLNEQGEGETGSYAITPLFGVRVPIIADSLVQMDKGTGAVMCCTFGDETDIKWWRKHGLPIRQILKEDGRFFGASHSINSQIKEISGLIILGYGELDSKKLKNPENFIENYQNLVAGLRIKEAREAIIEKLKSPENVSPNQSLNNSPLKKITPIKHSVKCAERSGVPIEIILTSQWFIKILPFKEELKAASSRCNWYPDYMRIRIEQWIDGLSWDWCISRQRFFGVKFPAWKLENIQTMKCRGFLPDDGKKIPLYFQKTLEELSKQVVASPSQLPVDPAIDLPLGYKLLNKEQILKKSKNFPPEIEENKIDFERKIVEDEKGEIWYIEAETDIMDTWATSSITPQLSSKGISLSDEENGDEICFDSSRHQKLFPADMRPQAHEIIRTWAFYTIVKAYFHSLSKEEVRQKLDAHNAEPSNSPSVNSNISIPWKNLMISGWCLAADKTKMSKSKGNVVTPTALIQEKSADVVRYWASASNLGADIAYSEEVFKIGQKLITKLFNAAKFCSQHFEVLEKSLLKGREAINSASKERSDDEILSEFITQTADLWILGRLQQAIETYRNQFEVFEYARAREAVEEFFWQNFCDNYLEICKVRSYGIEAEKLVGVHLNESQKEEILQKQLSTLATLYLCLKAILKLFAPFIPHITEEIYSIIFALEYENKGSIHARGNFINLPKSLNAAKDQIQKAFLLGEAALQVIFEVRKFKSEKSLSMKTTIQKLEINLIALNQNVESMLAQNQSTRNIFQVIEKSDFEMICDDLANVCNALNIAVSGTLNDKQLIKIDQ